MGDEWLEKELGMAHMAQAQLWRRSFGNCLFAFQLLEAQVHAEADLLEVVGQETLVSKDAHLGEWMYWLNYARQWPLTGTSLLISATLSWTMHH